MATSSGILFRSVSLMFCIALGHETFNAETFVSDVVHFSQNIYTIYTENEMCYIVV